MAADHVLHFIPEGPAPVCPQERGFEVPSLGTKGQQPVTLDFAQCSLAGGISITCKRARNARSRAPRQTRGIVDLGWAGTLRFHEPPGSGPLSPQNP